MGKPMQNSNKPERSAGPDKSAFTPLADARLRTEPFPYILGTHAFACEVADAAHAWLDGHAPWRRHVHHFFDQFEYNLIDAKLPPLLHEGLVSAATLRGLRQRMEALFSVELADVFSVTAHRLVPGQGIGVHTDRPLLGYESHRLVVHLGPEFRDENGGHLMFFHGPDARDFAQAFRTIHNSAVAFELSPRSFHAVGELGKGVRYTLVYSFWRVDGIEVVEHPAQRIEDFDSPKVDQKDTRLAPHAAGGATLDELTNVLVQAKAALRPTPETAVLPDLVHTYELLRSYECSDEVCLAGLFHGLYGTAQAPEPLLHTSARERVRAAIGEQAEALVYACCAADYESFKRGLTRADPSLVASRWRPVPPAIDRSTLARMATLILAYRVARHARIRPSDEQWADELQLLALAEPHLDPRVRTALRRVYGSP